MDMRCLIFPGRRKGFRGDLGDAGELEVLESGLFPLGKAKPLKAADAVVEFMGKSERSADATADARRIPRRLGEGGLSSTSSFAMEYSATINGLEHRACKG